MPKPTPMVITVYDENDEVKATYTRSFVPWRLLKKAVKLLKEVDLEDLNNISESDIDAIASLVVDVFGDQFTLKDLDNGVDISEMVAVLQTITAKASGFNSPNPTPPGR